MRFIRGRGGVVLVMWIVRGYGLVGFIRGRGFLVLANSSFFL